MLEFVGLGCFLALWVFSGVLGFGVFSGFELFGFTLRCWRFLSGFGYFRLLWWVLAFSCLGYFGFWVWGCFVSVLLGFLRFGCFRVWVCCMFVLSFG